VLSFELISSIYLFLSIAAMAQPGLIQGSRGGGLEKYI